MKQRIPTFFKIISLTLVTCAPNWVQAHTGHGTDSLMAGLSHPLGADHLLAVLAVGLWSISALPANKAWQGPATFMLTLMVSALMGAMGLSLPFIEHAIALSVVVFGGMLVLAGQHRFGAHGMGLGLIATAATLHGLAHGAETPDTGFAGYAIGFLAMTACLHFGGVGLGMGIRRWMSQRNSLALGGLGAAMAGAGLYLFIQV
jgi:urease accessory protein